jgi:hypothetical protein
MGLARHAVPLVALALAAGGSGAQEPATRGVVRGRVVGAATGEPLPRAVVSTADGRRAAATDDDGRFVLGGVPAGQQTLRARALGYASLDRRVAVRGADTVDVLLALTPVARTLGAVRTEERAADRAAFERTPDVGSFTLAGSAVSSVPAVGEADVLRSVQLLAGVTARNDFTAGYNVRGGESDQNLVLLDGIPVYNPFHLGGLFGTFLDETVADVNLLTGGFPAQYGGRLSSVLDVRTATEARQGVHGQIGVSLLTSSLSLGGATPNARGSWNVAVRRTYADAVIGALTDRSLPYHFQDAQLRGRYELRNGGTLSFTGYVGRDVLDGNFAQVGDSTDASGGDFGFTWGNTLGGLAYRQPLRSRLLGDSAELVQHASITSFATALDLGSGAITFDNRITEGRLSGSLASYRGRHGLQVGYELSAHRIAYDVASAETETQLFSLRQRPVALGVYVDELWRPNARLVARLGLRAEGVSGTGWSGLSPRASVRYFLTPDLALTAAGGRYAQWLHALRNEDTPVRVFDFWVASDEAAPVATATHAVLGAERWWGDRRFIRVEGYGKRYANVLQPDETDDPGVRGDEFVPIQGHSYGVDVLLRQVDGPRFGGWLAYGYSVSAREPVVGGATFWPAQDRRHNLNLVASYRVGARYQMSGRFGYGSGTPYTNIVGQIVRRTYDGPRNGWDTGTTDRPLEAIGGDRNALRYPPFHRLDLAVSRAFRRGSVVYTPSFQLINAYNRRNTFTYAFDYSGNPPTRRAISQFPFLPSVGLTVEF